MFWMNQYSLLRDYNKLVKNKIILMLLKQSTTGEFTFIAQFG